MTIKIAPPGRTSVATTGVVQGRGANHCLSKAGSVHAWNTFSRGASMTRVRMRSRPSVVVVVLFVAMLSPFVCSILGYCRHCQLISLFITYTQHIASYDSLPPALWARYQPISYWRRFR